MIYVLKLTVSALILDGLSIQVNYLISNTHSCYYLTVTVSFTNGDSGDVNSACSESQESDIPRTLIVHRCS